jgi:arsenate reductase
MGGYGMARRCVTLLCGVGTLVLTIQPARAQSAAERPVKRTTVLFICPHGAAKSVLASAYFQRVAKERGLNVRVETAGIEPQEAVSPVVADHLQKNGYTIPIAKPRAVTQQDVESADVVISMGCDLGKLPVPPSKLQKWDDVPAPSEELQRADDVIRRRVMALVEELLARQHK